MTVQQSHLSHPKYRPDIDGLRALAVLAVVFFHAFPDWLRGGFIGVDVFFVISGYLISTIIFENLDRGAFSFPEFYARRIKRIFPALTLVLVFCFAFGWLFLFADEFKQLGKHIAAGAGFISNFVLWGESGYFDNSAETKPLLHLWSLAIEEQFYIIWPFLLWCAWKRKLNFLTVTIFVIVISFVLNVKGVKQDATATFYSPQTRFWELLSGSLLAWFILYKKGAYQNIFNKIDGFLVSIIYRNKKESDGKTLLNFLSFVGLFFLLYGFWRINKGLNFPGKWALVPVLGSMFLISAGPKPWINRAILSNKIFVWFGLISFPLYLWHWPLLSFARIIESDVPSQSMRIVVIFLSIVLAWLTYRFIERPVRFGDYKKAKPTVLVLLIAFVGYLGYNVYEKNGLSFRLKDKEAFNEYFDNSLPEWKFSTKHNLFVDYRSDCDFYNLEAYRYGKAVKVPVPNINPSCYTLDKSKNHHILLWGDSHAQHLYYGLKKNLPSNWQILLGISSGCIPKITNSDSDSDYCDKSNFSALSTIKFAKPNVVIVAQDLGHDVINSILIDKKLKDLGVAKVIFTGPVPHWTSDLPKIISRHLWPHTPQRTFVGIDKSLIDGNRKLREEYRSNGLNFLDIMSLFCNENGCLTRIGDDRLTGIVTHDYGHLLQVSSDYLAKNLLIGELVVR